MGYKDLGNNWNRKWLDDIKAMLKEIYDGKFLPSNSIGKDEIVDGVIDNDLIKNGALTNDKLVDKTLKSEKIGDKEIKTNNLDDDSITGEKLKDSIISRSKLAYLSQLPNRSQENLFDLSSFDKNIVGYYNWQGKMVSSSSYKASPFIKLNKGETVTIWNKGIKTSLATNMFNLDGSHLEFKQTNTVTATIDCLLTVAVPAGEEDTFVIKYGIERPLGITNFNYIDDNLRVNEDEFNVRNTVNNLISWLSKNNLINLDEKVSYVTNDLLKKNSVGGFNLTSISIPFTLKDKIYKSLVIDCVETAVGGKLILGISKENRINGTPYHDTSKSLKYNEIRLEKGTYKNLTLDLDTTFLEPDSYQLTITFIPDEYLTFPVKFGMINDVSQANKSNSIFYPTGFKIYWIGNPSVESSKTWSVLGSNFYSDNRFFPKVTWFEQNAMLVESLNEDEKEANKMPTYSDFVIPIIENDETHIYYDGLINAKVPSNYTYKLQGVNNYKDKYIKFRDRKAVVDTKQGTPISNNYKLEIINDFDKNVGNFNMDIKYYKLTNPSTPKNVLIIGDSLTEGTGGTSGMTSMTLSEKLNKNNLTNFKLIGTLNAKDGTTKHEGRGGWRTTDYTNPAKSGNPFAFNGEISFKKYCETNGFSGIDYCFVHLNWNSFTYASNSVLAQNMKNLINKISSDYPSAKIFIVGMANYSKGLYNEWGGSTKIEAWDLDKEYEKIANENVNWEVCHLMPFVDIDNGKQIIDIKTNPNAETTEKAMGDFVHMGDMEYKQIADVYYRYLLSKS